MDGWERTNTPDASAKQSRSIERDARSTDSADDTEYIVRRLTPTECARLQGFPDDWAADVPHSDSAEYKMWGNGIALPCVIPMMSAMAKVLEENDA